ncbi:MAG: hypothetical protein ACFFB2_19455 [Promethearchaeota archaeon]
MKKRVIYGCLIVILLAEKVKMTFTTDTIKRMLLLLILVGMSLGVITPSNAGELNGRNNVNSMSTIAVNTEWNATYGGTEADWGNCLIQTTDGGYALVGYTESYGAGNGDGWLVKTDASGQHEWNQTLGGRYSDELGSVIQTTDGGYVLAGSTSSYGAGEDDGWLVKTDASGQHEWNQTFGYFDGLGSIIQTTDGGYALVGDAESYEGVRNGWLVKTDANGQAQWNTTYGGTEDDFLFSVIQTADGGYALVGYTESYGVGNYDGWLVKTDANGQAQWNTTYGGTEFDRLSSLIQLADGGYVLAGTSASYGGNWLLKTDATGQVLWNYNYGSQRGLFSLIQTTDGGYALTGYCIIEGSGKANDCYLIRIDANGQLVWEKIFGGKEMDVGNDLLQAADGDLVIAGWTGSYGAGDYDMWLLKTPDSPPPSATPTTTPPITTPQVTTPETATPDITTSQESDATTAFPNLFSAIVCISVLIIWRKRGNH